MLKKPLMLLLLAVFLMATGCAAIVAGTATGVGVYSYYRGELKRTYPETFPKSVDACLVTLKELKITVEKKESDGVKASISAKQTDGTAVVVNVTSIAPKLTEVSVRSGVIGVWDKQVSELIHATIAKNIQP